ncbi:MAG: inner-rane translocator [Solirubrobacterales bacterium]|nr:inner-rane translocator [Solirubrobacterales bacterium]
MTNDHGGTVTPTDSATVPTEVVAEAPRAAKISPLRRLSLGRYTGVLVALLAVCVYLSLTQDVFLTWDNFMNIAKSNSVIFVLAIGATFVIISAGIDLSTVSAATASGMILGLTLQAGWSIVLVLLATVFFGLFLGLLNGMMITKLKISFLVVTLGTLSIYQSFALVVHDGQTISLFGKPGFNVLGNFVNHDIGPFPILLVFDLILLLVAGGVLRYTGFGRALFAVGSNPEAARLNGINVGKIILFTYGIAGLTAGIASVVQVGRLTSAAPQADPTLLLTVLAAVLIGGTAYTGGEGGVLGTLVGVLFLGVVQNGLTLSSVSSFWQGTVSGVILISAVGLGVLRDRGFTLRTRRMARSPSALAEPPSPIEPGAPS